MRFIPSALAVGLTLAAGAWAQDYPVVQPWYGYGPSHHASTYEEGLARGLADITRSAGAANLMHSEAAKNWEAARRQNIENRVYGTEAYFDMRRINREAREAERGPRPTQDDLARYARMRTPSRLSVSELDPLTGQIEWPLPLREAAYTQARDALESMFQARAQRGYLDSAERANVRRAVDYLKDQLRANISLYSPQDYAEARTFIDSLAYDLYAPSG